MDYIQSAKGRSGAQALLKGELQADIPEFFWISDIAKNLLHSIFIVDARDRPSAHEILAHEWFS